MLKIGTGIYRYNENDVPITKKEREIISIKRACQDAWSGKLSFDNINVDFNGDEYKIDLPPCYGKYNTSLKITYDTNFVVSCVCFEINEKKELFNKAIKQAKVYNNNFMSTSDIMSILPVRNNKSHKGTYGRCFVVGGSTGLTGAAFFCSTACLKCGSGLVSLGCPKSLNLIFETMLKEVMTIPLSDYNGVLCKDSCEEIITKANKSDVLVYGCGMSINDDINEITKSVIKNVDVPIIIDADGINSLSKNINVLKEHKQPIILTPHFMEFSRLTGKDILEIEKEPIKIALDFAMQYNVTVVLKSECTVIALPNGNFSLNPLGNPGMATGGSGDVLAGAVASFVGQGICIENATKLGVFVHSLAGDMSAIEKGMYSMTPCDILENITYALKYLGG
jgi:NAD(P)H-hydrate epimerase